MYTSIIFINNSFFSDTSLYCTLLCTVLLFCSYCSSGNWNPSHHLCPHNLLHLFFFWLTLNHTSFEKWRSLGDSLWCGQMVFRSSRKRRPAVIGRQPGFRLEGFFVFRCKKCVSDKQKCGNCSWKTPACGILHFFFN